MGGDHAPDVVVEGAIKAVKECVSTEVVLVGDESSVNKLLSKHGYHGKGISVSHAPEVVGMSESPVTSFRKKKQSSIALGLNLVKEGKGEAFFSAGNTGAVVCNATLTLGMLPGIERPGIAVVIPTLKGPALLIDVGANIDPKPQQLLQYGIMAEIYSRKILGKNKPSVGLLNVGEEETKGTGFIKETFELLSQSYLNFVGNVEGKGIFSGECDVIITDGFVGNVVLKTSESLAEAMLIFLKRHLLQNSLGKFGLLFLKGNLKRFKRDMDYSEYGGAPLLGVNGVVIIGHGRSNAHAIKNAIRVAREEVERKFNEEITETIAGK